MSAREALARALDALAEMIDTWARAASGIESERLTVAAAHVQLAAAELRDAGT